MDQVIKVYCEEYINNSLFPDNWQVVSRCEEADLIYCSHPKVKITTEMPVLFEYFDDPIPYYEKNPQFFRSRPQDFHFVHSKLGRTQLLELGLERVFQVKPFATNELKAFKRKENKLLTIGLHQQGASKFFLGAIIEAKNRGLLFQIFLKDEGKEQGKFATQLKELGFNITLQTVEDKFWSDIDFCFVTPDLAQNESSLIAGMLSGVPVLSWSSGLGLELLPDRFIYRDLITAIELMQRFALEQPAVNKKYYEYFARYCNQTELNSRSIAFQKVAVKLNSVGMLSNEVKIVTEKSLDNEVKAVTEKLFDNEVKAVTEKPFNNEVKAVTEKPFNLVHLASMTAYRLLKSRSDKQTVTLWGEMVDGPYGGGSQVLKAIAEELRNRGYEVLNNSYFDSDLHILNSSFFNLDKCRLTIQSSKKSPRVIHRIDGPIHLYRGNSKELDDAIFEINHKVATSTAYQSYYSWSESVRLGYRAVSPFIIRNACDPSFFYSDEGHHREGKLRIVSSSWSTNMRKGFDTYKWLDENLDFDKYEYTFIGRSPILFKNISLIDALPSEHLGAELRKHDLYLSASLNDPASNALLEGITSGLPVIYVDSGGHQEFSWTCGLSFSEATEIPLLLDQVARNYEAFLKVSHARSIKEVVDLYLNS